MKVVLVTTPSRTRTPNYIIPTGILSLAAYLEQAGHEVHVVDAAALRGSYSSIVKRIAHYKPDLIGIGGIITAYAYMIGLTQEIKRYIPKIPLVVGGQVVINNEENCFQHMAIDFIIQGYGEVALEKLTRYLAGSLDIEMIPALSYITPDGIKRNPGREYVARLDDLPLPAYHLIDMEYYATVNGTKLAKLQTYLDNTGKVIKNHRFITIMGTLGCTDKCTFCVHEQEFVGLKVYSNEYLVRHMEFLHEHYDINVFGIGEEMFLTTVKRAREFNELLRKRLPNVYWQSSSRGDFITEELVDELERGNCYTIAWGYESGSQKMLDLMMKRMTREKNINAYKVLDQSSLVAACSLMVGNVGEDNETINDTIFSIREAGIGRSAVFFASAYPGGRTWDWAVERGIIADTHAYLLAASDQDAAMAINVNLTPYPDFILKLWSQQLIWACEKGERNKTHTLSKNLPFKRRIRDIARLWVKSYFMPPAMLSLLARAYFSLHPVLVAFMPGRYECYQYKTDKKKAILPDNLIVNTPQKFMTEQQVVELARPSHKKNLVRGVDYFESYASEDI